MSTSLSLLSSPLASEQNIAAFFTPKRFNTGSICSLSSSICMLKVVHVFCCDASSSPLFSCSVSFSISFSISSIGLGGGVVASVYPIQASIPNTAATAMLPVSLSMSRSTPVRGGRKMSQMYTAITTIEAMRITTPITLSLFILA